MTVLVFLDIGVTNELGSINEQYGEYADIPVEKTYYGKTTNILYEHKGIIRLFGYSFEAFLRWASIQLSSMWFLVAAVYISFAIWQPILYGSFQPVLPASQVVIAAAALVTTRIETKMFQLPLLAIMIVQVARRGLVLTVGT